MTRPYDLRTVSILGSAALSLAAVFLDLPVPLRLVAVFWFVGTGPGLACVQLLGVRDPLSEAVLTVAISLVLATLGAEALVLTHAWSPRGLLVTLAAIAVTAWAVPHLRPRLAARGVRR